MTVAGAFLHGSRSNRMTVADREEPRVLVRDGTQMARSTAGLPVRLLASSRLGTPPRVKGGRRLSRSDASGSEHP
jgi:hypothetical protein